jgi:hypothetical protein
VLSCVSLLLAIFLLLATAHARSRQLIGHAHHSVRDDMSYTLGISLGQIILPHKNDRGDNFLALYERASGDRTMGIEPPSHNLYIQAYS